MRIGSLNNVNLVKWQPSDQRDVFIKSIPGYAMPLSFDLNSSLRTHVIDGILADTSNANLAADMEYLESLFRTGQLVWVDATDQYPSLCSFGKIAKLQGPTLDSSMGPFLAKFTIEFWSVPPWGTLLFNPWKQTGFKLRDIDGIGAEYMLDPTQMHCNYTLSEINQSSPFSVSWEFILDNQNPFTNVTSKQYANCDSLGSGTASATNPVAVNATVGGASAFDSISIDTTNFKEGIGSLKGTKASPSATTYYLMGYDLGTSAADFTAFDRLRMWFRCDQTGQSSYRIGIWDTSSRGRVWAFSLQGANTWMNLEVALSSYSTEDSGFDITHVRYLVGEVETSPTPPSSINLWLDDIRVEIGYINHCEDAFGSTSTGAGQWQINRAGQANPAIALDNVIFKEGSNSTKLSWTNNGASTEANYGLYETWDFSSYDFFVLWVRSDFAGQSTGNNIIIRVLTSYGGTQWADWYVNGLNANEWYRLVVPRLAMTQNNIVWTSIMSISIILTNPTSSGTCNLWVDEIAADVGNYAYIEIMLPDNLVSNQIQISPWNGSQYNNAESWGTNGYASQSSTNNYTLDGTSFDSMYGTGQSHYMEMYSPGQISSVATGFVGAAGAVSSKTYSAVYGTNNRAIFAVKMPPMTSDSISGNYPSNDLSGFQAINKMRLKITLYFPNDDTTYSGFDSL